MLRAQKMLIPMIFAKSSQASFQLGLARSFPTSAACFRSSNSGSLWVIVEGHPPTSKLAGREVVSCPIYSASGCSQEKLQISRVFFFPGKDVILVAARFLSSPCDSWNIWPASLDDLDALSIIMLQLAHHDLVWFSMTYSWIGSSIETTMVTYGDDMWHMGIPPAQALLRPTAAAGASQGAARWTRAVAPRHPVARQGKTW